MCIYIMALTKGNNNKKTPLSRLCSRNGKIPWSLINHFSLVSFFLSFPFFTIFNRQRLLGVWWLLNYSTTTSRQVGQNSRIPARLDRLWLKLENPPLRSGVISRTFFFLFLKYSGDPEKWHFQQCFCFFNFNLIKFLILIRYGFIEPNRNKIYQLLGV
jgi:hypothetical protein